MVRGRLLDNTDSAAAPPVVLINQALADLYWPESDPVGARLQPAVGDPDAPWIEIVGVVADIKNNGLHRPTYPSVYLPLQQLSVREMNFVVRSDADPSELAASLRGVVGGLDSGLPIYRVMTMEQIFDNRFWGETLSMKLFVWCALGALLLAVVGIYGVISYSVGQRTHEMGVRLALGAKSANVVSLVVRQGLWLAGVGIAFGLVMGFGASRGLSFLLYGVDGNDPITYVAVVTLVAGVALLASYVPARRATQVDPVVALRDE